MTRSSRAGTLLHRLTARRDVLGVVIVVRIHVKQLVETAGRYWASHPKRGQGSTRALRHRGGITDLRLKNEATLRAYSTFNFPHRTTTNTLSAVTPYLEHGCECGNQPQGAHVSQHDEAIAALIKTGLSNMSIGRHVGVDEATVRRARKRLGVQAAPAVNNRTNDTPAGESEQHGHDGTSSYVRFSETPWGYDDYCAFIESRGQNPSLVSFTWGWTSNPNGGFWNKLNNVRPIVAADTEPAWMPVHSGPTFMLPKRRVTLVTSKWNTAVLAADTQFGYRRYEDGSFDPFHDEKAIEVALKIIEIENPAKTVIMGDIIDFAEQGRFAQEASFAGTTQAAIDRATLFAAQLRGATGGDIEWIEGNHDKRFQNFIEANAKAAFGIRKGGLPDTFPVMSIPSLCRLDEYGVTYHDAYPAAHVWINNVLRAEHGTKVNSNGSTAQKYMAETPHVSRAFGHTHRLEAQSRTTFDRAGKIRSMGINPGCLCRVDGGVPSVKGAIGANGRPAQVFEDWQQGVAVVQYTDDDFFVDLVQIEDGRTVYQGQEIRAD